jgi:DNA-binding MarR family transcriptional regulator
VTQASVAFGWQIPSVRIGGGTSSPSMVNDTAQRVSRSRDIARILKARRARAKFFDGNLFADPAWDMLLELYSAELAFKRLSISSLCLASNVPATTALRWIRSLECRGLAERQRDPHDGRRIFIRLTELASSSMQGFFQSERCADHIL